MATDYTCHMKLLHNKIQARAHILSALERHMASVPDIDESPKKKDHMFIHHTTIATAVDKGRLNSLRAALDVINDQSDDVNKQSYYIAEGEGNNCLLEIYIGRPNNKE